MAHDLAFLPVGTDDVERFCTMVGGAMTNYLIRFGYSDGQALWVGSAEEVNSCVTTTNGTAASRSYVGRSITRAYRAGVWRLEQPNDPCQTSVGRRGQGEQMVPDGPIKVVVCRVDRNERLPARVEHGREQARDLAGKLNAVNTEPGGNTCHEIDTGDRSRFRLIFSYEDGPPAWVQIMSNCRPSMSNGLLQGDAGDVVRNRVVRLAPTP